MQNDVFSGERKVLDFLNFLDKSTFANAVDFFDFSSNSDSFLGY